MSWKEFGGLMLGIFIINLIPDFTDSYWEVVLKGIAGGAFIGGLIQLNRKRIKNQ